MQNHTTIKLKNGGETTVDCDDYERLSKFEWFKSSNGYALRQGWTGDRSDSKNHWTIYMHRDVNQTPEGMFTDHANGNKLDNRKCNLRTCDKRQNSANRPKIRKTGLCSNLKGVSFHPASGMWRARIRDGKWERTTYHKSEGQAALDYNRMAKERFGDFAQLNHLPDGIIPTPVRTKSSKFRGVSFNKKSKLWIASLEKSGKGIHLGSFQTETEAAECYNQGAKIHFGERAKLNQIYAN